MSLLLGAYLIFGWATNSSGIIISQDTHPKISPFLAITSELWQDPQWSRLLHYQKTSFGGYKSRIDDPNFFLAKNGRIDPKAELLETVYALGDLHKKVIRKGLSVHPICKYPARFAWLKEKINLPHLNVYCQDYTRFFKLIFPEKVWYVFSSYYLNNPSSSFGHSLLRFERKPRPGEKHNVLLDHGINFAAVPDTENPLLYAIKGLTGSFKGHFSALPYFYKVREYSDFESRDLWSYQLKFNQQEKSRLVQHLWELDGTYFDYYFFSENCSFQLLALLEVAKPNLDILNLLPPWVIPSETVKVLKDIPGLVVEELFRSSLYRKFKLRQKNLSEAQNEHLHILLASRSLKNINSLFSEKESAQIYDAALDFTEFVAPSLLKKEDQNVDLEKFKFQLLKARASLNHFSEELSIQIPFSEKPDLGHGTARTSIGGVYRKNSRTVYYLFEQRFAYHDFLDEVTGYPPHALIEFMNVRFSVENKRYTTTTLNLEHLSLLKIQSLKSFSVLEPEPSWKFEIGLSKNKFYNCSECLAAFTEAGIGVATLFSAEKHSLAGFLTIPLYAPLQKYKNTTLGLNLGIQTVFQISRKNRLLLAREQSWLIGATKSRKPEFLLEYQNQKSKNLGISGFFKLAGKIQNVGGKVSYYY